MGCLILCLLLISMQVGLSELRLQLGHFQGLTSGMNERH